MAVPIRIEIDKKLYKIYLEEANKIAECMGAVDCEYVNEKYGYVMDGGKSYYYVDKVGETENTVTLEPVKLPLVKSKKREGYFCCKYFDEENKKCTVHESKHFGCRLYPLTIDIDGNLTFDIDYLIEGACKAKIDKQKLIEANKRIAKYIKSKEKELKDFAPHND